MKIRKMFTSLALVTTAFAVIGTALPAQAATAEPVRNETVSPIQYGQGSFSLEGKAVAKAKVTSKSGAKIMLNISVKPMPAAETSRCWTVPVGTKVAMEGIWNGVPSVKAGYVVQAGDNTFCTKKGHGNQVFKKSCGNRAWGVPGGPKKAPPRNMPRVKGKVTFADYYTYSVNQTAKETVMGSASAEVAVYDDAGRTLCKASGAISGKGSAFSAITVRVRSRSAIQAEASSGSKVLIGAEADSSLHIRAKDMAKVELDGKVDAYCAAYPPTETTTYQAPTASGAAKACVAVGGQNGVITVSGTNPNSVAAPGTFTIGGQTKQFASVGAGQTVTWEFSGFAPGDYTGSFSLGAPINKSATFPVTVAPCPVQEHKNPTAEIFFGEHAVDLYGTMPVFGRVKAFDGAIATLGSPVVTPNDLGMISNWRPVSTERDGVTSCESGWVCYEGTFRVTKDGTPGTYVYGTMVATATDNQNGEFTTQPKQFSVYYAAHPET